MRVAARALLALGLAVVASVSCDQLSRPLDMTPTMPPPKCGQTTDASGQTCETCWDATTGSVISNTCGAGSRGTGGDGAPPPSPPGIVCKLATDANGQACKICVDQYGMIVGDDCAAPPTGSGGSSGGGMCIQIPDGVESSCKPYDTWKQYGANRCAQQNLQLTNLALGPSCGEMSFQSVVYTCCGGTTPPPPPPKCGQTTDASGQICKTCWDGSGAVISNDCVPGSTGTGGSGGSGGSGGGMCVQIPDGGPSSCKPIDTWKLYGVDRCAQQNLQLSDLTLGPSCAGGSYQSVVYICCATSPTTPPPAIKCAETTDANGQVCKTCWDQYAMVVSNDCADAGSTAP